MPLLDHFHPPLLGQRHWEGSHGRWAAALADSLNDALLPAEYFAEFQVTLGTRVEVDITTFTRDGQTENGAPQEGRNSRADAGLGAAHACCGNARSLPRRL